MKKITLCTILILLFVMLVGCKKKDIVISANDVRTATVLVNGDGTLQAATIETFDKDYYSLSELENFINEQVNVYNQNEGENRIVLHSLELVNGNAILILNYASVTDYASFNQVEANYSTVGEINTSGITLPDSFVSTSDGGFASKELVLKHEKYGVFAINENIDVLVNGKIQYYSNGVLADKSKLQTTSDGMAYIIFKP